MQRQPSAMKKRDAIHSAKPLHRLAIPQFGERCCRAQPALLRQGMAADEEAAFRREETERPRRLDPGLDQAFDRRIRCRQEGMERLLGLLSELLQLALPFVVAELAIALDLFALRRPRVMFEAPGF